MAGNCTDAVPSKKIPVLLILRNSFKVSNYVLTYDCLFRDFTGPTKVVQIATNAPQRHQQQQQLQPPPQKLQDRLQHLLRLLPLTPVHANAATRPIKRTAKLTEIAWRKKYSSELKFH